MYKLPSFPILPMRALALPKTAAREVHSSRPAGTGLEKIGFGDHFLLGGGRF